MNFSGQWERILDDKYRLELPAKIRRMVGSSVFLASGKSGGLKIFPRFNPPKGKEDQFCEAEVKLHTASGSSRILIGRDARRQFRLQVTPRRRVLLKGRGDHLELFPVSSK